MRCIPGSEVDTQDERLIDCMIGAVDNFPGQEQTNEYNVVGP